MTSGVLLDNDVVLKTACYSLGDEMLAATTLEGAIPAMLGVGRFVVRGRIKRDKRIVDTMKATAAFAQMLETVSLIEPDDDELAVAADLEAEASRRDLELDGGESQLLAILVRRAMRLLVTGDKRAISAMSVVAGDTAKAKVACLEQLICHILGQHGLDHVRSKVCAEPGVDRAIAICFGCAAEAAPADADVLEALTSYVSHLDRAAPGMLIAGIDLSAVS